MSNITQNKPATASNSFAPFLPARAVDGVSSQANRWISPQVPAWLAVDLQNSFWVNQWTANLMGNVGWEANYNIKNFKLQGSNDNVNWFDMDSVSNNTANQINRSIPPKLTRFLRVYISNGLIVNDGVASIVDFQAFEPANAPFLSNLVPSTGALSPAFDSRKFNYNINVASTVNSITFTPTTSQSNMVLKLSTATASGTVITSGQPTPAVILNPGNNPVTIQIATADGSMATTYSINVVKQSAASYLSALSLMDDLDSTIILAPSFSGTILNYTARADSSASSIKIKPTATNSAAIIKVNNAVVANGQWSNFININTGSNTITIVVDTSTTYTLVITK
jgi:hypothetical protein